MPNSQTWYVIILTVWRYRVDLLLDRVRSRMYLLLNSKFAEYIIAKIVSSKCNSVASKNPFFICKSFIYVFKAAKINYTIINGGNWRSKSSSIWPMKTMEAYMHDVICSGHKQVKWPVMWPVMWSSTETIHWHNRHTVPQYI